MKKMIIGLVATVTLLSGVDVVAAATRYHSACEAEGKSSDYIAITMESAFIPCNVCNQDIPEEEWAVHTAAAYGRFGCAATQCTLCLDLLSENDNGPVALVEGCGHPFHASCLARQRSTRHCSVCNTPSLQSLGAELHRAVKNNDIEAVKELLDNPLNPASAEVLITKTHGLLHAAAGDGRADIVQELLSRISDTYLKDALICLPLQESQLSSTSLHYAAAAWSGQRAQTIRVLLSHVSNDADRTRLIMRKDDLFRTALHYAIMRDNYAAVRELVDALPNDNLRAALIALQDYAFISALNLANDGPIKDYLEGFFYGRSLCTQLMASCCPWSLR